MVAQEMEKKKFPEFTSGDTVKVYIKVIEGESERIQMFEGTVISRRGQGNSESFTVRKVSFGVGVERTFPLNSPHLDKIEVSRSGKVRRSRLYYLRGLTGKAARLNEAESGGVKTSSETKAQTPSSPAPEPKGKASGGSAGVEMRAAAAK